MKFKSKKFPKVNDVKIKKKFCFLPFEFDSITYWLETIYVKYKFVNHPSTYYDDPGDIDFCTWDIIEVSSEPIG